jgi:DNA polymerase I
MSEKKLFLLDAYALIYRSYYAFIKNPRYNSKGINTSAIFGFTNTLIDVLKNQKPSHIAVVFDPPTPTFRHDMYEAYKANREETPEDIKISVPYIKKIIEGFNIPVIEVNGYEADDVIATYGVQAHDKGFTVYMMTPDKDYAQVVREGLYMYKPGRSGNEAVIWGPEEVKKAFSITEPAQVRDILALMGDASDNIPGAAGIGEKTAIKLIAEYGSVDNLIEKASAMGGKAIEKVLQSIENVRLSQKLVAICTEVPIEFDENQLLYTAPIKEKLQPVFDELEFRAMMDRVFETEKKVVRTPSYSPAQPSLFDMPVEEPVKETTKFTIHNTKHDYFLVDTAEKRADLIQKLNAQKEFCFDTETTGLTVHINELVGMSFCFKAFEAYYVPVPADKDEAQKIIDQFKPVFENENIVKIGQNLKFDIQVIKQYGVEVKGKLFDTMLAHYLVQPELRHNMNFLAELYLNYTPVSIEELIGAKGKNQLSMRTVPVEVIKDYAAEDADVTFQLKQKLVEEVKKYELNQLAEEMEMPLIYVLADVEWAGIKINSDDLKEFGKILSTQIIELEKSIIELTGGQPFNIASPKQLGEVLFDKMKLVEKPKQTKASQQHSTSEEALEKIKDKHPVIEKILEFRSLKKLLSGYVESLPELVNAKTGKIHTSFNQAVTSTGRLSSNNPNLQNIPIRDANGREIRKAFIASHSDNVLLSADYSQIELRIMAHMSGDAAMIEAFNHSADIHTATAAKIYNVAIADVTSDMRRKAKTANFGIIYGISVFGLAERLTIPRAEAKELIDGYFANYPGVKAYMTKCIHDAHHTGYVSTLFGRRRYLKDIHSANGIVRGFAERNAINAPIQGTAADIIKIAMIKIHEQIKAKNLKSRMILQVHDELVFDVYKPELDEVKSIVKSCMENVIKLAVPLLVEMGVGDNWLDAH